jgi:hypothetical protein
MHSSGRPLPVLAASAAQAHEAYQRADYGCAARMLPALLEDIQASESELSGSERLHAQRIQAIAYIAASKLASKAGDGSLAWLAADRAATAARIANAPELSALAAYQVACAFLCLPAKLSDAERVAVTTADDLGRLGAKLNDDSLSVRGSLLLLAALIAARQADAQAAKQYLADASVVADQIGRDDNRLWTAFGSTNVAIHEVSVAVTLGRVDRATEIGEKLDTSQLAEPLLGRRAQVHLDLAAAYARRPSGDPLAVLHLIEAERVAPQALQVNVATRSLLVELLGRESRARTPGLRSLARRSGVLA